MVLTLDEAFLPATLTAPPMTDQEFLEFCQEHPDLSFETTAEGELVVMPPTHSRTGIRNSRITRQLDIWAEQNRMGYSTDSSTGIVLPNGARRSPDAAWTPKSEVAELPPESRDGYWHLCPAFVIELRSHSDRMRVLREKMREYIENGAQLGWLIDPEARTVEIYRPNCEPELREGIDSIAGEGPVEGFTLDLKTVWDPFAI
jgi:Uma2 family endonuclease